MKKEEIIKEQCIEMLLWRFCGSDESTKDLLTAAYDEGYAQASAIKQLSIEELDNLR